MAASDKLQSIYDNLNSIRTAISGTVNNYTKATGILKINTSDYIGKIRVNDILSITNGTNTGNFTVTEITSSTITGNWIVGLNSVTGSITGDYKSFYVYFYPIDPRIIRFPFIEINITGLNDSIKSSTQYTLLLKYDFELVCGVISERDENKKLNARKELLNMIDSINNKLKLEINDINLSGGVMLNSEVFLGQIKLNY